LRLTSISILGLVFAAVSRGALAASCAENASNLPAATNGYFILAEGDSITAGQGASDGLGSYVDRAGPAIKPPKTIVVRAKSQSVLGWPEATTPPNSVFARIDDDNSLIPRDKQGRVYILSLQIGRNDLMGYGGGLDRYLFLLGDYAVRMRRAGWDRVVLGTVLPSDWEPFGPVRKEFNQRILANCWYQQHGFDAVVDFDTISELNVDGAATNKKYFVDGIHPTNYGYQLMSSVYAETINAIAK
jgi:GDSL-like Lipase/Acylhydrolase family